MLDNELLNKAVAAGKTLSEAERQALLARAEYHTIVRRLHLAGGSLREIAGALSLSHQRVQQMVDASGGSWWRRVWRTRIIGRDAVCSFCDRPPSEVSKLIAGPNVYICDSCISLAEKCSKKGSSNGWALAESKASARCSFCSKRRSAQRALLLAKDGSVCSECLETCRKILDTREV